MQVRPLQNPIKMLQMQVRPLQMPSVVTHGSSNSAPCFGDHDDADMVTVKAGFFSHWYPPQKLKYGKLRLGEST